MLHKSILQCFRPSLSSYWSLRLLFCLFLSGRLRQVLLLFNCFAPQKKLATKVKNRKKSVSGDSMCTLTLKAPPIICSRRQLKILLLLKVTNKVCWQTIPCNIIPYFCRKLRKMSQNLSSAAVVIGALRV